MKEPNSSFSIRFQCILHDPELLFPEFSNFYKLKRGVLISGGNQLCRTAELFGSAFCLSVLKVSITQFLRHSLDFNASVWFRSFFLRGFKFPKMKEGGPNLLVEPILQNGWFILTPLLFFNFKTFKDQNSSSFITFQCIL